MRSKSGRWLSGVGAVLLVCMLLGTSVVVADDDNDKNNKNKNPFTRILNKLDEILAAITAGGGAGNHTLRWDTNNPSASRFTTAFPGAVLDKNTGLVWEQAPDATPSTWFEDIVDCVNKNVGGTTGWRLPSVVELKSVQDPTLPAPFVPASVFTGVQSKRYWSATTRAELPTLAWFVDFELGSVGTNNKSISDQVWCVRGGMNADAY